MVEVADALSAQIGETSLRSSFDNHPLGIFVVDNGGRIKYLNDEAARIIGVDSIKDTTGQSLYDVDAIMNCGMDRAFQSVISGRTFHLYDHRCSNCHGHYAVLNVFCSPYRKENGEISGILGILQDVTDTFKRKSELEEAIYELSIMGQVSEALSSAVAHAEILQMILTAVTANQGLGFNRAFLFLLDQKEGKLKAEMAIGPGSPQEAGEIWSRLASQQKTLIELLNDYRERENSSINSLGAMINGWEITLNDTCAFSRAVNEGIGINVFFGANIDAGTMKILEKLNTQNLAVAPIISNGRRLGLIAADNQITGKVIRDADVQLLQTFANHTAVAMERSQLHEDLVEHAACLEEKNRQIAESQDQIIRIEKMSVIGELTSSIAHELRNPLTVIGGFANLMLSSDGRDGNSEYLNIILSEARRAESVLNQVLDFSRASRTKTRAIDFNHLTRQTYELFLSRLKHNVKPPKIQVSDATMEVWGNPDQLQHALFQFMNLTIEELTGECKVCFSTAKDDGLVRFVIGFQGSEAALAKVKKTLQQIFGSSTGTQRLSIIVAGETIKYHGGGFGLAGGEKTPPEIYIELPEYRGENNA
ncbi:MAG: hypothetical protein CVT49_03510 [candidate division Zixibacteria bacterium HGW-Zixibacteria-1]|nr:MAG: hypothetical protein CVT49_03510 [candidate division Zixibacteria bacterium HGW-Zixibacteria-1]